MADGFNWQSSNPNRPGDTSNFNPTFAANLQAALAEARAKGLNVGLASGYRRPTQTGSSFDASGRSLHRYGMAADISGIGNPGSATAQQWHDIAVAHGLFNPYFGRNPKEWNHYQALPYELTQAQAAPLMKAAQTGNWNTVVAAGNSMIGGGAPNMVASNAPAAPVGNVASAAPSAPAAGGSGSYLSQRDQHIQFIRDYAKKIGLDPDLALGIAGAEGLNAWSAKNPNAGSYIDRIAGKPFSFGDFQLNVNRGLGVDARNAGIDPSDPNQWQAADRFALDRMKAGGVGPWRGDPVAKAYLAGGQVKPFVPGTTLNTAGGPAVGSQTGDASGGAAAGASGVASTPGTSSTGQPTGTLAGSLPGFTPGSPGANMTAAGLKTLTGGQAGGAGQGGGGGGGQGPPSISLPPPMPAMPAGGPMMLGPGGQNTMSSRVAEQALMQRGFNLQPSLAANNFNPAAPSIGAPPPGGMPAGAASGIPGLPGTTLNSPSQLQMALMTGNINPYDVYANAGFAGGFGS